MKKFILICMLLPLGFGSCIDYGHFGLSKEANILSFDIQGQLSNRINEEKGEVVITIPPAYLRNNLLVTRATCTQLAQYLTEPYELTDFTYPVEFEVMAEDTTVRKKWSVKVYYEETASQIPFSEMKEWTTAKYNEKDITYKEGNTGPSLNAYFPGNGTDISPWQSAAYANSLSFSGIYTMTTTPRPTADNPEYARLETVWISKGMPVTMDVQIVTGALFTGEFVFNLVYASQKKPRKMVNLGMPFQVEPNALRFKMRYKPGEVMRDGTGEEITAQNAEGRPLLDSCDIYAILQNRMDDPDRFIRVGAAQYRTSESVGDMADDANGFVEVTIPFVYGKPDGAALAEKPYLQIGGSRGEITFYKFPVTTASEPIEEVYSLSRGDYKVDHICILFSSSVYGDNFWGAVNAAGGDFRGSILDIKDVELIYD